MKKLLVIIFLAASISSFAQTKNFIDQNYIEVTGKAEMEVVPDRIYIKVLLSESDSKNRVSVPELEEKLIKKLKKIGIDLEKDVFIKDMASNIKFHMLAKNKIYLSKEYQVIAKDGKTVAEIFLGLEEVGISNVSIEKVENSKIEEYRKEVKINAIKAAKEKAIFLANAIKQEAGRAIFIGENNFGNPTFESNNIRIRGASTLLGRKSIDEPLQNFEFEKIKLESTIMCRFVLK